MLPPLDGRLSWVVFAGCASKGHIHIGTVDAGREGLRQRSPVQLQFFCSDASATRRASSRRAATARFGKCGLIPQALLALRGKV